MGAQVQSTGEAWLYLRALHELDLHLWKEKVTFKQGLEKAVRKLRVQDSQTTVWIRKHEGVATLTPRR